MSSAVISTSAAQSRPFIFDDDEQVRCHPERSRKSTKSISCGVEGSLSSVYPRLASVTPASQLAIRAAPEMAPSGISALDALTGGLPRGCLTEICGPVSSGRTTILLAALAAATHRGEYCAVIDASDSLDPRSVAAAGVELDRLLWVRCNENSPRSHRGTEKNGNKEKRNEKPGDGYGCPTSGRFCQKWGISSHDALNFDLSKKNKSNENTSHQSEHRLEQVLRATDLLLESGGFGLIILDLADIPPQSARRIPLTTWFRFRRAVEHKPTILLAIEQHPIAGSCSSLLLQLRSTKFSELVKNLPQSGSSREAATGESPARQSRVSPEKETASRRDGTISANVHDAAAHDATNASLPSHAHLLTELKIHVELIRSRLDRKPARSIAFETKTAWAG